MNKFMRINTVSSRRVETKRDKQTVSYSVVVLRLFQSRCEAETATGDSGGFSHIHITAKK